MMRIKMACGGGIIREDRALLITLFSFSACGKNKNTVYFMHDINKQMATYKSLKRNIFRNV